MRYLPVDGVPWFALRDLWEAAGFPENALSSVESPDFPSFAKLMATEAPDPGIPGEPEDVVMLSPVGVWYWSHLFDPGRGQAIAAWAKREAAVLNPRCPQGNPHMFLALLEGGDMPPYPLKYSGRKSEWIDLNDGRMFVLAASRWQGQASVPIIN